MPFAKRLAEELRELRRLPGPLGTGKVINAPALIKGLGAGDPELALSRLSALLLEHSSDREIAAAMASIGIGTVSESVLDRLTEVGQAHFVDSRTVRRWSDAGISKVAALIVGQSPWLQPQIQQRIDVSGPALTYKLRVTVPAFVAMKKPKLVANGDKIGLGLDLVKAKHSQTFESVSQEIDIEDGVKLQLDLAWSGEKLPQFVSRIRSSREIESATYLRLFSMRTVIIRFEH